MPPARPVSNAGTSNGTPTTTRGPIHDAVLWLCRSRPLTGENGAHSQRSVPAGHNTSSRKPYPAHRATAQVGTAMTRSVIIVKTQSPALAVRIHRILLAATYVSPPQPHSNRHRSKIHHGSAPMHPHNIESWVPRLRWLIPIPCRLCMSFP